MFLVIMRGKMVVKNVIDGVWKKKDKIESEYKVCIIIYVCLW